MKTLLLSSVVWFATAIVAVAGTLSPTHLRCEYIENPLGIDAGTPRLSWRVESKQRAQKQTAYQIWVASTPEKLAAGTPDLWDSGKVASDQTLFVRYAGKPLASRQVCYWNVSVWDAQGSETAHSETATWTMGLLDDSDWSGNYISYRDQAAISTDVERLHLPAARQYRKEFGAEKEIKRATVYATALGIYELHLNGQRVSDAYFAPGWTDYRKRAYYNTYDVTGIIQNGDNALGAWVADGWYAGYVGFGLLTGMGTEKTGRATYGKTPSLMAQLEIEYADGTRSIIGTDSSWKVTADGPIQEADLLMGEAYDATRQMDGWSTAGFDDSAWQSAVLAMANGNPKATFYQRRNPTKPGQGVRNLGAEEEFGFKRPSLEAFPGVPVRITQELPARTVTRRGDGNYVFDLGQNFAGVIRLKLKGPAGQKVQIRYGEMLHPGGRLMTENLRKARATDFYTLRGDENGEEFQPRFTFHGFQYVEVTNYPDDGGSRPPSADAVTGLVLHSDTPMVSTFQCSDPMVNRLFQNVLWTQRSNFLDLPTDCPQRDERMGWTGDAQAYVATAAYNADIGAFYTKWLRELMESQRPSGVFPGYAPFPFQHGWDFGTAWADAGVICPWTVWQFYGDTGVIEECWEPMVRFMDWRKRTSVNDLGISHGNAWGDWLAQGADTPLDYIDSVYYAISAKMMSEMADATGREEYAKRYREQFDRTRKAFQAKYMLEDGSINIPTQTAQALALFAELIPESKREGTGKHLAEMLAENGNHMSTGFLGTRPLLPVLSSSGQHDLAMFLLQSREFPSWGYEIANGATTIWERWDSYTKEDAFGRHNAAMNSFSHYAFGAVCEWMFDTVAGIRSDGPGFKRIIIRPQPSATGSNAMHEPINWVRSSYDSIRGTIRSDWKIVDGGFQLQVTIPANTTATVYLPTTDANLITESGLTITGNSNIQLLGYDDGVARLEVLSGVYDFAAPGGVAKADAALRTSKPVDQSINPFKIDVTKAKVIRTWDFSNPDDVAKWSERNHSDVVVRDGKAFVVATGDDSQLIIKLGEVTQGPLAIGLKAMPAKGSTSQFFWSRPGAGFNGTDQSIRPLASTDQVNEYLFTIPEGAEVKGIRFDPFQTFDAYADRGEMMVESITLYQLPAEKSEETPGADAGASNSDRPNVLFVLTEDQGAHLSHLGTPGLQTPNMDALASSGVYFRNAFVAYPVCSASKGTLYTGLHAHTNGILNNTHNFHKQAAQVTDAERNQWLAQANRIQDQYVTLTEVLAANGYYQGVTHKLHVLPNEKFPYDQFMHGSRSEQAAFLRKAKQAGKPWFLMVNIPNSHRPYPNSDKADIRVNPSEVTLPKYLPDSPEIRKDWAEYYAGIEQADALVGQTMSLIEQTGQVDNTIIVFMSDHGPTFQHGKMTLYDLGLRVPLIFAGPSIPKGVNVDALASGVDFLPTLLESIEASSKSPLKIPGHESVVSLMGTLHGKSLRGQITTAAAQPVREFVFAEISNRGPLPNDGIQERSVQDARYKLIVRQNVEKAWRQVNADSRDVTPWGNRTYNETVRLKDKNPKAFRILAEMDPQNLRGAVPTHELYDLVVDPDEMNNLIDDSRYAAQVERLTAALLQWMDFTNDHSFSVNGLATAATQ